LCADASPEEETNAPEIARAPAREAETRRARQAEAGHARKAKTSSSSRVVEVEAGARSASCHEGSQRTAQTGSPGARPGAR